MQRSELAVYAEILAQLKFEKERIQQFFREEMTRESGIYQEILEKGYQEEKRSLILQQLTR